MTVSLLDGLEIEVEYPMPPGLSVEVEVPAFVSPVPVDAILVAGQPGPMGQEGPVGPAPELEVDMSAVFRNALL